MKVAVVWNHASRLLDCSFRFERYLHGLRELGHEPILVCHEGCEAGFPAAVRVFPAAAFEYPETWREVGAEVALVVTWIRMSATLDAMRRAGMSIVAISDSDGLIGARTHPRETFAKLWIHQRGPRARIRCVRFWCGKYLRGYLAEDEEHLRSTRLSDVLVLGSSVARRNFLRFLRRHGEERLGEKVIVVPFNIGETFLSCPLPAEKDDRIAAIGRWADPQKNVGLLVAAVERLAKRRPSTRLVVLGSGGRTAFAPLVDGPVDYLGEVGQAEVARTLATARSIVFSSHWEGSPHAAFEALASGATLIGTPIPSLLSWSEEGRFGRIAPKATPAALARAMLDEMALWDRGDRDPHAISGEWRRRLAPDVICRDLLAALGSSAVRSG